MNNPTNPDENVLKMINKQHGIKLLDALLGLPIYKIDDWSALTCRPELQIETIMNNLNKPWNWKVLSYDIPIDDVIKHPDLPWNWNTITRRADIEIIMQNPHCNWSWFVVHYMEDFNPRMVIRYPDKGWHWYDLSTHPNLTLDIVKRFPNKPWNHTHLCSREMKYDLEDFTCRVLSTSCIVSVCDFVNENGYGDHKGKFHPSSPERLLADIYIVCRIANFL